MGNLKSIGLVMMIGFMGLASVSQADSLLEKIATAVLADKFGIDTREVVVLREQSGLSVYDLAPIYEGSHYFHRSPSTVWQLRQQGMGWGEIAHKVGMHPGTFNKLRKQGAFDRDRFWTSTCHDRFSVPVERVEVVRRSGGTLEDVLGAVIIGKLANRDPRDVYDQFKTERSWTTVTQRNNVQFEQWRRVSAPVKSRMIVYGTPKVKSNNGVRDHGEGVGKGKSQGKFGEVHGKPKVSADKGKSHGKGNGGGNSQAHGNGKGGGNGQSHGKGKGNGKGGG